MSLKAKMEAVIYAAEEPVTLTQLSALFADEAMEWKAEQEAAKAASADSASDSATAVTEPPPYLELEPVAEDSAESSAVTAADGDALPGEGLDGGERAATGEGAESAETSAEAAEAEAKREAKQRDREVRTVIKQVLDELIAEYAADGRGIEIREIAGGYRMATKPQCHDAVRSFVKSLKPPLKLSLPALETLAVIAYKQPVTAPEVNEIRGVDSSAVFGSLLARKLIVTAGRKPVIGRPILYKTTKEFLLRFGLKDVSELPSMEEFEKMAASELDEAALEAADESAPAAQEFNADMSVESEEMAGEAGGGGEVEATNRAATEAESASSAE
jgi:segregation and condensation protein B